MSSLVQVADEDKGSDVSEADVTQMAKSIADLDDLDADLFTVGAATKTPKRGSLKEKSGKPGTPRRSGTPRSRGGTPRASSPPLRMISPANRVISPTHQRVTSPQGTGRGTPTSSTGGIDPNRAGSGSKKSSVKKPASPKTEETLEYRPTTAPGKMTDLEERHSVGLKPGQQDQERPKTVPKAKTLDFGDFDADDPLAGIPLSDDEEDLGFGSKKPIKKQVKNSSPRAAPSPSADNKQESPRQRSFFDRPPTRSGSNKTESPEKDVDIPLSPRQPVQQTQQPSQKPALSKRRSEDLVFSDDDDLIGGLGIEDKGSAAKPKAKPTSYDDDDENRPAKSVMDKLLGKDSSVSKHLDHGKERKEFILDTKYTQPAAKDNEDDFQFGSYMPSAVGAGSNSSRPTSRRSVRFQDDDDIFGFNDTPSKTAAKKEEDSMDWLEMATAGRTKPQEKAPAKETKKAPDTKPGTAPSKTTSAADWLGLKDDDDDDDMDFLKSSSFSAPARQTQAAVKPQSVTTPAEKPKPAQQQEQKPQGVKAEPPAKSDDYLGLGEEIDPSKLLSKTPTFESAARRMNMSPRMKSPSPRRSPERKSKDPSPRSLEDQLKQLQNVPVKPTDRGSPFLPASQVPQVSSQDTQVEPETDLNSSTNFFVFKKKDSLPARDQPQTQSMYPMATQSELPASQPQPTMQMTGNQPAMSGAQQQQLTEMQGTMSAGIQPNMQTGMPVNYQWQQQQQQQQQQYLQQQAKQQQMIMKQLQRQQQQMQRQQQQQMQKLQQQMQSSMMPDMMMLNPMFNDDMGFGLGGNFDVDAQAKIRRLEAELQNTRDLLLSTRSTCDEEIAAREKSFRTREQLLEETHSKKEQRWREETELLMSQHLNKVRQMEQEKSELLSSMYKKLEESESEKSQDIERLKSIHRQALESLKKDHDETLMRLKVSKDQQIEAAASSHDTSRSLVAAVELIRNNAKDVGDLQRKIDTWHSQGLDDREITLRAKDEQLKMLQDRLNKQQEDNDQERQRLQELIGRLETQIREQTRMLEEERWKVKQEQSRLQGMQTALEDERRAWSEHQARERTNMEKTREALLEEQKSTLTQLHKERQVLAEEQVEFNMKQKMAREEGNNYSIKTAQARAEYEALTKAIAEARDRYETIKEDIRKEQDRIQEERRVMEKERSKMEKKEAELMEAANMLQEKSQQIEDTYTEGQRKYEEGMAALQEATRVEGEEGKRIDTINHQLNLLRVREKEIAEERLRLSKEKRECEKFRSTLLCPNCRTPTRHFQNGAVITATEVAPQGLLMPSTGYPNGQMTIQNGSPVGYPQHLVNNPALQLSVNTVDAVTESIRSDRSIRLWKMEALKDQKYLEEQTMFLHTLKHMPYTSPKS